MTSYNIAPRSSSRAERSGAYTAPHNFDPATYPIIACHYFGMEPLAAEVLTDLQLRSNVVYLDWQGSRQ